MKSYRFWSTGSLAHIMFVYVVAFKILMFQVISQPSISSFCVLHYRQCTHVCRLCRVLHFPLRLLNKSMLWNVGVYLHGFSVTDSPFTLWNQHRSFGHRRARLWNSNSIMYILFGEVCTIVEFHTSCKCRKLCSGRIPFHIHNEKEWERGM